MSSMSKFADWPDLPPELIILIFEKLVDSNISNLSNCVGVCVSWRSVRAQLVNNFSPIILLADQGYQKGETGCLCSGAPLNQGEYRIFNTGTREIQEIMLPELHGKWFRSIWPGWLFTTNSKSPYEISVLNPLTGAQITLPPSWGDKDNYNPDFTVVPSSNPSDSKCIFLATYRCLNRIKGFCRPGDTTWSMTTINYLGSCIWIRDAIYFNGDFYITGYSCHHHDDQDPYIYRIQIDENNMTPTVERLLPLPKPFAEYYLVELMGKLLLITKYDYNETQPKQSRVTTMEVHKLELNGDDNRWLRVSNLGGKHAIYTCHFQSFSIYVGESNSRTECRPNCVYVFGYWPTENGVFDVVTGSFKKLSGFPASTNPLNWFSFQ